jgi:precorrin-8X/cobalt-precorrin-8 methylmutase
MPVKTGIAPQDIEALSFSIIENEFEQQTGREVCKISELEFPVVRRVIHATGDFSFADTLLFHAQGISSGLRAIREGKDVFIDVGMGAAGINRNLLASFGGEVICTINDPGIAERARESGRTRTETALRSLSVHEPGIIAIGNAPTALLAAIELIKKGVLDPELVIGVPVGFVNAEESKELLSSQSFPFITSIGRKGGSPVAVAIINALLNLATDESQS